LLAQKEGRIWFNIIYLKLYEFERISFDGVCMSRIGFGICHAICLEISLVGINILKTHGLLLKVGLLKIPEDHETLSKVRHVGLHVDFS
jgi:hypothetical protein